MLKQFEFFLLGQVFSSENDLKLYDKLLNVEEF